MVNILFNNVLGKNENHVFKNFLGKPNMIAEVKNKMFRK